MTTSPWPSPAPAAPFQGVPELRHFSNNVPSMGPLLLIFSLFPVSACLPGVRPGQTLGAVQPPHDTTKSPAAVQTFRARGCLPAETCCSRGPTTALIPAQALAPAGPFPLETGETCRFRFACPLRRTKPGFLTQFQTGSALLRHKGPGTAAAAASEVRPEELLFCRQTAGFSWDLPIKLHRYWRAVLNLPEGVSRRVLPFETVPVRPLPSSRTAS